MILKRIFKKISSLYREYYIKSRYSINGNINILGKVYLDNPNIYFGDNVSIYEGVQIWGNGKIYIGDNTAIGKDTIIFAAENIYIGNDVSIAAQCYIIDSDHGMKKGQLIRNQELIKKPIRIEDDVWIGAGSKILKGSYISQGSVVGALALVNGVTESYSINVGIPYKKIGER